MLHLAQERGTTQEQKLTLLGLRHSFATDYLEHGGAVTDLMQQLGHSKLETTQIYASGLSERRRETVMALEFGRRSRSPVDFNGS